MVGCLLANHAKLAGHWIKVASSLPQNMDKLCQDSANLARFANVQPTMIQRGVNVEPTLVQDAANLC